MVNSKTVRVLYHLAASDIDITSCRVVTWFRLLYVITKQILF
jgi:hypothetical protein